MGVRLQIIPDFHSFLSSRFNVASVNYELECVSGTQIRNLQKLTLELEARDSVSAIKRFKIDFYCCKKI